MNYSPRSICFSTLPVVAEDLGVITPDVVQARDHYELPGMLVMQFAFFDDHATIPTCRKITGKTRDLFWHS